MPRYRVLQKSYINERIVFEGEEVEYDGIPGDNLEPLDAAAKRAAEKGKGPAPVEQPAAQGVTPAMPHPSASPANAPDPELVPGELDASRVEDKPSALTKEAVAGGKVPAATQRQREKDADLA